MMTPKAFCESVFQQAFLSQGAQTRTWLLTFMHKFKMIFDVIHFSGELNIDQRHINTQEYVTTKHKRYKKTHKSSS